MVPDQEVDQRRLEKRVCMKIKDCQAHKVNREDACITVDGGSK